MDRIFQFVSACIRIAGDYLRRLYDWCMNNKRMALAAAAGIVVLIILLSIVCCAPRPADEGFIDDLGISWAYYDDGTLCFTGSGEIAGLMTEYTDEGVSTLQPEWYAYREQVTTIDIGDEITYVGMDSFVEFTSLSTVIVRGKATELDIESIRYETEEGWETYAAITLYAYEDTPARSFAEFSGFRYRPL